MIIREVAASPRLHAELRDRILVNANTGNEAYANHSQLIDQAALFQL